MHQGYCPECSHRFKLKAPLKTGGQLACPKCKVNLIITSASPLELDLAITTAKPKTKQAVLAIEAPRPECDHPIKLKSRIHQGAVFMCENCSADLEVVSTNPVELDLALPVNFKPKHTKK